MLIKEELMAMVNADLAALCKERGISVYKGKTRINKQEMVDKLLEYNVDHPEDTTVTAPELKEELKEVVKENPVVEVSEDVTKITPWVVGDKDEQINRADVGTLIAFLDFKGKPRTGKLVNRSAKRREVKLVTEYEAEFIVSYDSVLWVRFGTRWPKMVYQMLKEYKNGKSFVVTVVQKDEEDTGSSN